MPTHRKERLDLALARLKASGLKLTPARSGILQLLVEKHGPFTHEQIRDEVGCDLVTVYRTLNALEKKDLIQRCEFGDGTTRYELNDPESHHHHVVCRSCGKQEAVELCPSENLNRAVVKMGYRHVGHLISFYGICSACTRSRAR